MTLGAKHNTGKIKTKLAKYSKVYGLNFDIMNESFLAMFEPELPVVVRYSHIMCVVFLWPSWHNLGEIVLKISPPRSKPGDLDLQGQIGLSQMILKTGNLDLDLQGQICH